MDKRTIILFKVIALLLILNVPTIGSAACERGAPINVENNTNEVLTIFIDEYRIGDVDPNKKIKNNIVFYGQDSYLIEAYDSKGKVIFSRRFSDEEIEEIDWKVVIPPLE